MLAILAIALVCRLVTVRIIDRALDLPAANLWLVPVRDMLSFAVFIASFPQQSRGLARQQHSASPRTVALVTIGDDRA